MRSRGTKKEYACGKYYNTLKFRVEFPEVPILRAPGRQDVADDAASVSGYTEVGPNDIGVPGCVMCFAYALPFTYTDLRTDLENCRRFLLSNGGKVVNEVDDTNTKVKKQVHKNNNSADLTGDEGVKLPSKIDRIDRFILTKNELAQRELKKMAIKSVKEKMSQFEISLLKADEEQSSPVIKSKSIFTGPKLLEIHTDYLYYKQEIVSQSVGGLNVY